MEAEGARGVHPVVEGGLVELGVLLVGDLGGALLPDRGHGIDGIKLGVVLPLRLVVVAGVCGLLLLAALGHEHLHGIAHVVAVATDELAELPLAQELVVVGLLGVLLEGHDDGGAGLGAVGGVVGGNGLDRVALHAVRDPAVALVRAVRAADDGDLARHHEGGVEAHAKAADDVHGVALGLGVGGLELLGAGVGDGAEVLLELLCRHADAVVGDRDGSGVLVKGHVDGEVCLVHLHGAVREALEVELVDGVRGVGDQLAEEDLAVGVDGVDHEVEELLALCLELAHATRPFPCCLVERGLVYPTLDNLSRSRLDIE